MLINENVSMQVSEKHDKLSLFQFETHIVIYELSEVKKIKITCSNRISVR